MHLLRERIKITVHSKGREEWPTTCHNCRVDRSFRTLPRLPP